MHLCTLSLLAALDKKTTVFWTFPGIFYSSTMICTNRKRILLTNDQVILILYIHLQTLELSFFLRCIWFNHVIWPFSLNLHFDYFHWLSIFIGTTNTTFERKAERDTDKKDINTITRYMHYIKIIVILAGTVLSLTLLLLIAREIYKLFRMSETSDNYQSGMATPVVNNTSGDITTSLYNSWGTQD